jgi:hypothetical protein
LCFPLVFAALAAAFYLFESCENTILEETRSSDGHKKLVIFERKCSGTVAWTTHVAIVDSSAPLPNRAGNTLVFYARHGSLTEEVDPRRREMREVQARWTGPSGVELTYWSGEPIQFSALEIDGVRIAHKRTE